MYLRLANGRGALEEVEVAALVGLRDVTGVEVTVAAGIGDLARLPVRAPRRELFIRHLQRQLPRRDVELDDVAVPDEGQRAADERLRRDVQDARAVLVPRSSARPDNAPCRAPLLESFFGMGSIPTGHARAPSGPASCSTSTEPGVTGSDGSSIRAEVVVVPEHDGGPACWSSYAPRRWLFDDRPSGADSRRTTHPFRPDRALRRAMTSSLHHRAFELFPERPP